MSQKTITESNSLIDSNLLAYFSLDTDFSIINFNEKAEKIFSNLKFNQIIPGRKVTDYLSSNDKLFLEEKISDAASGYIIDEIIELTSSDNKKSTFNCGIYKIISDEGKVVGYSLTLELINNFNSNLVKVKPLDSLLGSISNKTNNDFSLRDYLSLFECLFAQISDALIICSVKVIDEVGPQIVFVNEAFSQLTGYKPNEILGKSIRILEGPKTDVKKIAEIRDSLKNSQTTESTTINYKKNGEEFWCHAKINPASFTNTNYTHWIAILHDVTDQKFSELNNKLFFKLSQLLSNRGDLRNTLDKVLNSIVDVGEYQTAEIWLIDEDKHNISLFSKYENSENIDIQHIYNGENQTFKLGEGIPGKIWEIQQSKLWRCKGDLPKLIKNSKDIEAVYGLPLIDTATTIIGVLVIGLKKDIKTTRFFDHLLNDFSHFLGTRINRNIIELELNEIYNNVQDIICIAGYDGYFRKINAAASKLLEYSQEELMKIPFIDLVHPDDREKTKKEMGNLIKGDKTNLFENKYLTKTGKTIWLSWTTTPNPRHNVLFAVARDITQNKKLSNLLDQALSLAQIGSWEYDFEKRKIYWSKITREIHEVPEDFQINAESAGIFYTDLEAREQIKKFMSEAINSQSSWDTEVKINTYTGKERWIRIIGKAEFKNGKCTRLSGSMQNIHQRKTAELEKLEAFKEKAFILESIDEGFMMIDQNWYITYWNKKAEESANVKKEEVLGKNIVELYDNEEMHLVYNKFNEAIELQSPVHFENYYAHINTWHEISIYPYETGLAVFFTDITKRRESEELLKISNERFENVADATNDAIWDWDIQKNTVYWGKGFKKLFGYDNLKDQQSFEDWIKYIHKDDLKRIEEEIEVLLYDKSLKNFYQDYRFLKKNGEYAYVKDRGLVIRNDQGIAIRMVGAMADITHHKEYEASLKKLNSELKSQAIELTRSNEELEQFAYIASHDLQEPLRMVTSFLSQLERKYKNKLDEKGLKYIEFAVDGGKRMRQIILDLLDYSRVGRTDDELEDIDLNELVNNVSTLLRKSIKENKAKIIFSDLPIVKSYRSPLILVFQNLLSNAIKYKRDGVNPIIKISCQKIKNKWEFSVSDNGLGISKEYYNKIFEIFQRLHNKDEYSGTGIGLSIVKKIIENLGGKIWLNSEEGKGTTFNFTLTDKIL